MSRRQTNGYDRLIGMNGLGKELIGEWELAQNLVLVLPRRSWIVRHLDGVTGDLSIE